MNDINNADISNKKPDIAILLDNIRSVHNAGSIFRTAETLGITNMILAGTTPTPLDRFNRKRKDFAKVSLGSEEMIRWQYVGDAEKYVKEWKKSTVKTKGQVIALEQDKRSTDYKKITIHKPSLIILGNEVEGVSKNLLKLSDVIAEIPMKGGKESLNVSVAAGVFLFRLLDN